MTLWLLGIVLPLLLPGGPDTVADALLRLGIARAEYARALDAAGWDRRQRAVHDVADRLTAEAVDVAATVPPLRDQAESLATDLAGAPLGELLHRDPTGPIPLLAAWEASHPDAALLQSAVAAGVAVQPLALALASQGSVHAGTWLAVAYRTAAPEDRAGLCAAARTLSTAVGQPFTDAVVQGGVDVASDPVACIALAVRSVTARRAMARTLAGGTLPVSRAATVALLLDATGTHTAAGTLAIDRLAHADENSLQPGTAYDLADMAPWLDLDDPRVRQDLRAMVHPRREPPDVLDAVMLAMREEAHYTRAVTRLGDVHAAPRLLSAAMLAVAALMPARDDAAVATAVAALNNLAERLRAYGSWGQSPRGVELWREALVQGQACHDDPCLHQLLTNAPDESAARAAAVLGARGLGALPPDVATAVVRRMVLRETPALTTVVLTQVRGCPEGLRGLTELARPDGARGTMDVRPFAYRLRMACAP